MKEIQLTNKIKLPRKRKKMFTKKYGNNDYILTIMAIQVCNEMNPEKISNKFIKSVYQKQNW